MSPHRLALLGRAHSLNDTLIPFGSLSTVSMLHLPLPGFTVVENLHSEQSSSLKSVKPRQIGRTPWFSIWKHLTSMHSPWRSLHVGHFTRKAFQPGLHRPSPITRYASYCRHAYLLYNSYSSSRSHNCGQKQCKTYRKGFGLGSVWRLVVCVFLIHVHLNVLFVSNLKSVQYLTTILTSTSVHVEPRLFSALGKWDWALKLGSSRLEGFDLALSCGMRATTILDALTASMKKRIRNVQRGNSISVVWNEWLVGI